MTNPLPESSTPENTSEDSQDSKTEIEKKLISDFHNLLFHVEAYLERVDRNPEYDSKGKLIEPAISIVSYQRSRKGSIYQIKVLAERE